VRVTLVENSEHNIDGEQGARMSSGWLESESWKARRPLKTGANGGRESDAALGVLDDLGGIAQRNAGREIEGQSGCGILALVVDGERGVRRPEVRER